MTIYLQFLRAECIIKEDLDAVWVEVEKNFQHPVLTFVHVLTIRRVNWKRKLCIQNEVGLTDHLRG